MIKMDEDKKKSLSKQVFGKDLADVPCLRTSFIVGITGGMAVAFVNFMASSKAQTSFRRGFMSYVGFTITAWIICRSSYSMKMFRVMKIKEHIPKRGDDV